MTTKRQFFEVDYYYCPRCKNELKFKLIDGKKRLHCQRCDFIFYNNPKPVVSGLLIKNKEVLLIKRNDKKASFYGYWSLPGGILEIDEEPKKGLEREFAEETGIAVRAGKIINGYLIKHYQTGRQSYASVDIVFEVGAKKIYLNKFNQKEVSKIDFFSIKNLPKKIAFGHKKIIINYLNKL
ncbi:MAG: NUDIX domain-containing protein [Microgenomates group bacterium]|nr:NUDIX domain-containing protein [Microgenomates group bacterium]